MRTPAASVLVALGRSVPIRRSISLGDVAPRGSSSPAPNDVLLNVTYTAGDLPPTTNGLGASNFHKLRLSRSASGGSTPERYASESSDRAPEDLGPLFIVTDADCWLEQASVEALSALIAHERSAVRLVVPLVVVRAIATVAGGGESEHAANAAMRTSARAALCTFAGASKRLVCKASAECLPAVPSARARGSRKRVQ